MLAKSTVKDVVVNVAVPVELPPLPALETRIEPALIVVLPVYVFEPVKTRIPAPFLASPPLEPAPAVRAELIVCVWPDAMSMMAPPDFTTKAMAAFTLDVDRKSKVPPLQFVV